MQICHDSQNIRYRTPFGAVTCGQTVTLNLYAPGCHGAAVRLWREGFGEQMIPMKQSAALFSAEVQVPEEPCILWYFFVATFQDRVVCYGNNPESLGGEGCIYENSQPPSFQITVYEPFTAPSWYKKALVYQIFPDRFARGEDYSARKEAAALPEDWKGASRFFEEDWSALPRYVRDETGTVSDWQFFGGTLKGILEKIPYLKSMGVTALYLNPITKAASNHRYDAADYMQVDPLLGDNEIFRQLAETCRKEGIRILLDGVFRHTGADSIYFDKYDNYRNHDTAKDEEKEAGAFLHPDSKYRSWYHFQADAPGYACLEGQADQPLINATDPSFDMFLCGPGGVLENWIRLGASGFRLDEAEALPDPLIRNIRDALCEADPDSLLLGEVRGDASNRSLDGKTRCFFTGDALDGVMNDPFRDHAIDYLLGKEDAGLFCRKIKSLQENYPKEAFFSSLNHLGGHNSERILSVLGSFSPAGNDFFAEDGTFYPKGAALSLSPDAYALAKARLKLLSVLQYTMPGVPCLYYGDEAGVQGNKDPDNRRTYPWGSEDADLLFHYRMLGLLYHSHSALKDGDFAITERENCLFLLRRNEEETLLTVINPSGERKFFHEPLGKLFGPAFGKEHDYYGLDLLSAKEITVQNSIPELTVDGFSALILLLKPNAPKQETLSPATGILCGLSALPEEDLYGGGKTAGTAGKGDTVLDSDCRQGPGNTDAGSGCVQTPGNTDAGSDPAAMPDCARALGRRGRAFVDWLSENGFGLWQLLPVNPPGSGNSPYFSPCVFAGDTRLLDAEELPDPEGFAAFCNDNQYWLNDWAEYAAENGFCPVINEADAFSSEQDHLLRALKYDQYVFYSQLKKLKEYANSKGVLLIGDLPIYAAPESADVKAHPECFQLDENGRPLFVGGVPPDYFSETGQYWSNPLYDWEAMKRDDYEWWYQRLRLAAGCFDHIRLDHFRSFSEYFAIPEGQPPRSGHWRKGPGTHFFDTLRGRLGELHIIAEDLGQLDSGVYDLMKLTGFPGMNIWQFHAEEMKTMDAKEAKSRIFYSGTHDNQTLTGWCKDCFPEEDPKEKAAGIMKEMLATKAPWIIFQLQDILLLDDSARTNIPGTVGDNWIWQCREPMPEVPFLRR